MIKNTFKAITEYAQAYDQAIRLHNQSVGYIKKSYKEGSDVYDSAIKTATDIFNESLTPMKDTCVLKVRKDFEDLRKAIKDTVTAPPSPELLGMLPMIKEGKMSDMERQMFIDTFKGNYADTKLFYDAIGKPFKSVDSLIDQVNRMEDSVNKYFDTYKGEGSKGGSYNNAVLLGGRSIEAFDHLTDEFLNAYAIQEE